MARSRSVPLASPIAPSVHLLATRDASSLAAAFAGHGASPVVHSDLAGLLVALEEPDQALAPTRLVVRVDEPRAREMWAAANAVRRLHPDLPLTLVLEEPPPSAAWDRAAMLTTACFAAALDPETLATLVLRAPAPSPVPPPALPVRPRRVTIALWERVLVDDEQVYLGVAERNFLYLLARKPGIRIAKSQQIEAGPGKLLSAGACRRRLGQRLGPDLAELLVPTERFEPYRLREPADVETLSIRRGLGVVTLRIVGRGEVRLMPAAAGYG